MELRELYDENRRPLHKTVERDTPLEPGEYHIAVGIWVFSTDNRILLTRRSLEKKFAPGKWENTSGHVTAGETSEAAVLRELREETGIEASWEDISFLGSVKVSPYFGDNYAVRKDVNLKEIILQPGETCDVKWVTLEEFDQMAQADELASSVVEHLKPLRKNWEDVLLRRI